MWPVVFAASLALQPMGAPKTISEQPGLETAPPPAGARPAAPFPNPIITEVLYAVPGGAAGDANRDGKRESAGDEFVELVNPHDKPIQLFGYTLTDSQEPGKGQMRFTFPAMELAPGAVVVVFNGLNSTFAGPVGDNRTPPPGPSEAFGGAWVFTMRNSNSRVALGNSGDHVMLTAPDGVNIQRVWWSEDPAVSRPGALAAATGAGKEAPPALGAGVKPAPRPPLIDDYAPIVQKMSVSRDGVLASGRFVSTMDAEHVAFSPGVYRIPVAPGAAVVPAAPSAATPDPAPKP